MGMLSATGAQRKESLPLLGQNQGRLLQGGNLVGSNEKATQAQSVAHVSDAWKHETPRYGLNICVLPNHVLKPQPPI